MKNLARNLLLKIVNATRLDDLALALQARSADTAQVVVVEMHETLSTHAQQFRQQLEWAAKHFVFIGPESFARAIETKQRTWQGSRPAILFTFDDGRESNFRQAAPILESFGTRGIFFVVPQFVGLTGQAAKDFYYSRIDIRNRTPASPPPDEVWTPMTQDQLADLSRRGHWIGNHTLSHVRLSGLSSTELAREIGESSRQIALWTGKPVDALAWTYAWDAIDPNAWHAIQKIHRFCFTPCPGTVDLAKDSPFLIWRKEIESYYSPAEYQFMYTPFVDLLWHAKRKKLQETLA